jgi:hypothetical protein
METHICDECRNIISALNEAPLPTDKVAPYPGELVLYEGAHHRSLARVHTAADEGCGICSKITVTLADHGWNWRIDELIAVKVIFNHLAWIPSSSIPNREEKPRRDHSFVLYGIQTISSVWFRCSLATKPKLKVRGTLQ